MTKDKQAASPTQGEWEASLAYFESLVTHCGEIVTANAAKHLATLRAALASSVDFWLWQYARSVVAYADIEDNDLNESTAFRELIDGLRDAVKQTRTALASRVSGWQPIEELGERTDPVVLGGTSVHDDTETTRAIGCVGQQFSRYSQPCTLTKRDIDRGGDVYEAIWPWIMSPTHFLPLGEVPAPPPADTNERIGT